MKWLLILFVAGGYPAVETQVPNLPSQAACDKLAGEVIASLKKVNSSNRYTWGCYSISGD